MLPFEDWSTLLAQEWPLLVWYPLLAWAAWRWSLMVRSEIHPSAFLLAFHLKLLASLALAGLHLYVIEGCDTCAYFSAAKLLARQIEIEPLNGLKLWWHGWTFHNTIPTSTDQLWIDVPQEIVPLQQQTSYWANPQAFVVVRLLTLLWWPAGGSLGVLSLFCAAAGFAGIWLFFREFIRQRPDRADTAFALFFLMPCVFFWSSGLLKDSWCFGAQCAMLALLLRAARLRSWKPLLLAAFPAFLIHVMRPYLLAGMLPFIALCAVVLLAGDRRGTLALAAALVCACAAIFMLPDYLKQALEQAEYVRSYALAVEAGRNPVNSGFDIGPPREGISEVLRWGEALTATLFRPWPWEAKRWIAAPMAMENAAVFLFTLYCLLMIDFKKAKDGWKSRPLLLFLILFPLAYGTFIGLSTSFFGSLWRYKIYVLPFLLLGLSLLRRDGSPFKGWGVLRHSSSEGSAG